MSHRTTRRQAASGLAALFAMPRVTRAAGGDAAVESTLTWYVAQVDAQTAESLGRAFTKSHPVLKERHELTEYTPANAAALLPTFKALSDPGYSYITNAARYFLIYNKDKVKPEDVPRAWTDLLDPKWKGRVATGHPAFSGCTGTWALGVKKVHGWDFFEKLAKNNPRIGRSAVDPMTLITAGECLVGVGSANNAYASADKGNPIGIVHPSDGLVLCVTPSAIPARAPHPNAAKLFMEWLLSPAYAQMITRDGSEPILEGVAPHPGMPKLADVKVIPLTVDEIRSGVPEIIEQWRDTFGG